LYRIRWRNDWSGLFECWTRSEDETEWRQVANYGEFPTRVYQDGDENTILYAMGNYYRGDGGVRQHIDYGGRARSNAVDDAELGTDSSGFRELAELVRTDTGEDSVGSTNGNESRSAVPEGASERDGSTSTSSGVGLWILFGTCVLAFLAMLGVAVRRHRARHSSTDASM
jgi:hypothetical protein